LRFRHKYTYEPFGTTTESGAASANSFQYTGRENDGTGLHYYRARYYNAAQQRFVSEDPVGGAANPYAYVGNAPLTHVDPTGLTPIALPIPIPIPIPIPVPPIPPAIPVIVGGAVVAAGGWTVGQIIGSAIANAIDTSAAPSATVKKCDRRQKCHEEYLRVTAKCGELYPDDERYNRCMERAWRNYIRCINGLPPSERPFEP
jgi:RHS repeat-associated protein